jgi:hypothetical protein
MCSCPATRRDFAAGYSLKLIDKQLQIAHLKVDEIVLVRVVLAFLPDHYLVAWL